MVTMLRDLGENHSPAARPQVAGSLGPAAEGKQRVRESTVSFLHRPECRGRLSLAE